ncbi:MAG: hypothetical protein OEV94_04255 [Deltaproteobacteria bacterium]|nr:hypothetical protein [Deltaproteobacteria bacterium]
MTLTPGTIYTASVVSQWSGNSVVELHPDTNERFPLASGISVNATIPGTVVFKAPTKAPLYLWVLGNYRLTVTAVGAKPIGAPSISAIAFNQTSITNGQPFTGTLTTANVTSIFLLSSVSYIHSGQILEIGWGSGTATTFSGETLGDTRIQTTTIRPASIFPVGALTVIYNYDPEIGPYYHVRIQTNANSEYWEETTLLPPALTVNSNSAVSPLACAPTLTATPVFGIDPVAYGQSNTITLVPNVRVSAIVRTYYATMGNNTATMSTSGVVAAGGGVLSMLTTIFNTSGKTEPIYAEVNMTASTGSCTGNYLVKDPLPYDASWGYQLFPLVTDYIVEQRDPINRVNYRSPTNIPVGKVSVLPQ